MTKEKEEAKIKVSEETGLWEWKMCGGSSE
jgi:hypothetical protein